MSNETCTVSIADIYGAEWWKRNREELDREWEWSFGVTKPGDKVLNICLQPIASKEYSTAIILHRRKPKTPTLQEVYGTDEVKIPQGWEWVPKWDPPMKGDTILDRGLYIQDCKEDFKSPRLILRKRQPKVWFKAEDDSRVGVVGDWVWLGQHGWRKLQHADGCTYLCANRHEEIDQTVHVVTQADVDKVVGR